MNVIILNVVVAMVVLTILLLVWGTVHIMARKRLGERELGCKGPVPDRSGVMMCCRGGGKVCENGLRDKDHA